MHELSIAMSLVEMVGEEAERRGTRVLAAYVSLGQLSGVVKEALLTAFEVAAAGTGLEGIALIIEEVPAAIHCAVCQQERPTRPFEWFSCDICGTPSANVVRGRELELTALELE